MKTWIMANQLLAFFIAIIILIGIYYLVKYLMKSFKNSDRIINNERDVIVEDTIIPSPMVQTFSTNPSMSFTTPSSVPSGGRVSSGGRTH